ncbi:MAG: PP2C family protein-serine/threonine phosphatase [Acidimicrobiales bacterium]
METPLLAVVAVASAVAALMWGRSARYVRRVYERAEREFGVDDDAAILARAAFRKDLHTTVLYVVLVLASGVGAVIDRQETVLLTALVLVPVLATLIFGRGFIPEARLLEQRSMLERRAEEVLSQEELAPRRWAQRLAPEDLPDVPGFEVGRVYSPGTGLMAGDFYDVFRVSPTRVAAVIGDVTGSGIDASITAFQAKYLLRVFLREYRDPGQAIEELNAMMFSQARPEEFISLLVVVFDTHAGTLRFASAGHPAAWLWHDREVQPLRTTGPLLLLDAGAGYFSREIALEEGDTLLLYTDGLAEARDGEALFGEERVAQFLRRDPGVDPHVLCKSLLEAARDFASAPLTDDIAILAIRRT